MAVTSAQLQQIYLAYFGRPADSEGLQFYTAQPDATIWTVAAAFSSSPESRALYGTAPFGAAEVNAIYLNLFNRPAEQAGINYWVGEVAAGRLTAAGAAAGILLGAQNEDKVTIQNKLTAASAFTGALNTGAGQPGYAGDAAAASARAWLGTVSDAASLAAAVAGVDAAVASAVNRAPIAVADTATTAEDTAVTIDVLVNDTDADGANTLSIKAGSVTVAGGDAVGTAAVVNGKIVFTPAADWNGTAVVNYVTTDGVADSAATVTVTVAAVNDAPVAVVDATKGTEDTDVVIDVLANDRDADGANTLSIKADSVTVDGGDAVGTAAVVDGKIVFTPAANWSGTAVLNYVATDGTAESAATVTVTVAAVNDAPVAVADTAVTREDTAVTIDVLANDSDADGILSIKAGSVTVTGGNAVGTAAVVDGKIVFTPAANWNGTALVNYVTTDGAADSAATVTVTVAAVNDAPVAVADTAATAEDTAVTIDVLANDRDADTGTILSIKADSVTVTGGDAVGTAAVVNGKIVFTPAADWNGSAVLNYVTTDGTAESAATVTVAVAAVNDAPVIEHAEGGTISGGGASNAVTAAAVVSDVEANWNGGKIAITVEAGLYFGKNADDGAGLKFAAVAGSSYAYTVASNAIIATHKVSGAQMIVGSFANDGATLIATGAVGVTDIAYTGYTVTLNGNATSAIVSELMSTLRIEDVVKSTAGGAVASQGTVTVKVTDAAGAAASFGRLLDSDGATSLDSLAGSREVGVIAATGGELAIDLDSDATFADGGANWATSVLTVRSDVAGDAIDLTHGVYTAVSGKLVKDGATIIGDISGDGTNKVTVNFNVDASAADVQALVRGATIKTTAALGDHTVSVNFTDGLYSADSGQVVLSVVRDFATVTLAALRGATIDAPVEISHDTILIVAADDDGTEADLARMVADGKIIVTGTNLIRVQSTADADIKGVTGFGALGEVSVTEIADGTTLTMDAGEVSGVAVVGAGAFAAANVFDRLDADLSGIAAKTANTAQLATDSDVEFSGKLGTVALTVTGGGNLTLTASIADGASVSHDGAGNIVVTGLDAAAYDLSGIASPGAGDVTIAVSGALTLNDQTRLPAAARVTVAADGVLVLTAAQADGLSVTGADALSGAGHTGGSIVVTALDQTPAADLSGLIAGTKGVNAENADGTVTAAVTADTTFTGVLGAVLVTVGAGVTLTGATSALAGQSITGAGNVVVTGLGGAAVDLSSITVTGTETAVVTGSATLHADTDLAGFAIKVNEGAELTLTAAQANGVSVVGADATVGANGKAGSVIITIDGAAAYDLAKVFAGAASADADDAGTVTATTTADTVLDAGTTFDANTAIVVGDGDALTLSAAQANGRAISGDFAGVGAETVNVVLTGASTLDLSHVEVAAGKITALTGVATASIDVSGMNLGGLTSFSANDGDVHRVSNIVVTMTAAQADAIDMANGGAAVLTNGAAANADLLSADTVRLVVTALADDNDGNGVAYVGSAGNDQLAGSAGADHISGGAGNDVIDTGAGNDSIFGGAGNDVINAGAGDDFINGGAGKDILTGGDGDDVFVFAAGAGGIGNGNRDVITDFTEAGIAGGDQIDLSAFAGIKFIGTDSFTVGDTSPEVRYAVVNGNAVIEVDANGDHNADFQIELTGVVTLTGSDFIL